MTPAPGLPDPYRLIGTSSFAEVLSALQPDRLASLHHLAGAAAMVPHGTTIVSLRTSEGVVMAGDRRATMGNIIAQHDIEKVFVADDHSVIGIAGAAGLAVELVRLFQVELEHYEKIEGLPLSLDGKANRLATLLRSNLGLALQGLAVVPLFAGFDLARQTGRIFSYDPTGGRYEEHDFYAVGSGSTFARGSLKKLFRRGAPAADAVRTALEALYDAADDDSATAGPDMARGIYPVVAVVDSAGARILPDAEIAPVVQSMVDARMLRPDGGPQGEEAGS